MDATDLNAILDHLELDDDQAACAFGLSSAQLAMMRRGIARIPFHVSAMSVLMCESEKVTQLALDHGAAMKSGDVTLKNLLADTAGMSVGMHLPERRTTNLRVV